MFRWSWMCGVVCLAVPGFAVAEQGLVDDYLRAMQNDTGFAVSMADSEATRLQAKMAGTAFFPEARLSATQLDNESSNRITATVTQPLVSVDRWLMLGEVAPRTRQADSSAQKNRLDLAVRVFKIVRAMVESREKGEINDARIKSFEVQVNSAQKMFDMGLGGITDLHDAEVRLAQARSQSFSLQAEMESAIRGFANIVGEAPEVERYRLIQETIPLELEPLEAYMSRTQQENPVILSSEQSVLLAEIARKRAKATMLPSVNAVAQRSRYEGEDIYNSMVALQMTVPVQAGSYYKNQSAAMEASKLRDAARDVRQKMALEVQRLYALVSASAREIEVRRAGIRAAEISLTSNQKSFEGGVRSRVDVLNAMQALFQSKGEYVTAVLQMGESLLNLQLLSAKDPAASLELVQTHIFQTP